MFHVLSNDNISINIGRAGINTSTNVDWNLVLASNQLVDYNQFARGGALLCPLYLNIGGTKEINYTSEFLKFLSINFKNFLPEDVFSYVYAILYSDTYRKKYAEFLKIDFPRIPFTNDEKTFKQLAILGNELIEAHLLKKDDFDASYGNFIGKGDNIVEKTNFVIENKIGKLYINKTQYFDNVPQAAYDFFIGGYQVLDKYLKDRKGKELTANEVENMEQTIRSLVFTIAQMTKIDGLTKNWI
jgi:predicted helicase